MKSALQLARKGEGLTRPNPPVGAIVVLNNEIVGTGYHRKVGCDHAEVAALKNAGTLAQGATIFVTLEPCSTVGRTPPCTDAILKAGIKKVVVSVRDPNPKHAGRGIALLKHAGVEVLEGVCADEGKALITPFAKWITKGMPYVTLKLGMTIDGSIADFQDGSKWITGAKSRATVQAMRRRADAVCVGSGTARIDNPSLLPRPALGRTPYRVVFDTNCNLPDNLTIFNDVHNANTIVVAGPDASVAKIEALKVKGVNVWQVPIENGRISLKSFMQKMGEFGVLHALIEGGGEIAESLTRHQLVDEFVFFVAPLLLGGVSKKSFAGNGWLLEEAPRLVFKQIKKSGEDIMIRAVRRNEQLQV